MARVEAKFVQVVRELFCRKKPVNITPVNRARKGAIESYTELRGAYCSCVSSTVIFSDFKKRTSCGVISIFLGSNSSEASFIISWST